MDDGRSAGKESRSDQITTPARIRLEKAASFGLDQYLTFNDDHETRKREHEKKGKEGKKGTEYKTQYERPRTPSVYVSVHCRCPLYGLIGPVHDAVLVSQ